MNVLEMFGLDGKIAIVTGAHAWLGYDMACALAEAGGNIIVTSRDLARAQKTAKKLRDEYGIETLGLAMATDRDHMFRSEDKEFLRAIVEGTPVTCPPSEALKSQRILEKAKSSNRV